MGAKKLKLLIVEDEPDICTTAQSYFSKRNFVISTTGSGLEALFMIKASRPDIVLLDISLNDISGLEALKQLREYDKETKVVIITGQQYSDEEVEKIECLGISGYKDKPLVLHEVEKLVYETLGLKRPEGPVQPLKETTQGPRGGGKGAGHKLSNLLGIIRNKCENFTLNIEEGIYRDRSCEDLVKMSVGIMKEIQDTVDRAMEAVEQIK